MTLPIAAVEIDLARDVETAPVPARFQRARVLIRWSGEPIDIVELSIRSGRISAADAFRAVQAHVPGALAREAVRRALLRHGLSDQLALDSVWSGDQAEPPASAPSISLAICTRDRTDDLAACLASIARLDLTPLEVLVIDNAPATDATRRLVEESYPGFRYVRENQPGLDHARNRAVTLARGNIIAFTDDDAVVDRDWLGALARAFAADPALGLVTGLAEPLELESRAQIQFERYGGFGRGCRRLYSLTRPGHMPWTLVGAGQLGAGVNMAVRREVFARIGLFDPALDVGTPTLGGGDHDLFYRVLRAGYLCAYEPAAVVRHRHRRAMHELRRLLYCYGHATRCFLEREALNFPGDRAAIRRLQRWWWRHWALARWWRAVFRPPWMPADLVLAEIKGFLRGRGAYAKARAAIVSDESQRPDADRTDVALSGPPADAIGLATVEVSEPLADLPAAAAFGTMELLVQWQHRPIGTVRIANFGRPLSARRIADEVARALWPQLLAPANPEVAQAFTRFGLEFAARLPQGDRPSIAPPPVAATVVVATCNRPDALRRCLQSLTQLRTQHTVDIVVVDNRPDLGTAAAVVRDFPTARLVLERRRGSSYARNAGVAAARGEFVAMIDDDMIAAPEWLDRLLAPFARADVMAVTGLTLPAQLGTQAEQMLELYGGFGRGFVARDFDFAWFHRWRWRAAPTWQIGGSGNVAFRRRLFCGPQAHAFAVTLGAGVPAGVGEDTKLFYDLLYHGHTLAYEPAAVAWHHHRVSMSDLRAQLYAYSKGHVAYHLMTLFHHGDGRAITRLGVELPLAFAHRALACLRGRSRYPWRLLLTEMAGTLAGPWSLWRSHRLARQIARTSGTSARTSRVRQILLRPVGRPAAGARS